MQCKKIAVITFRKVLHKSFCYIWQVSLICSSEHIDHNQQSYSTPSPVIAGMGDCLQAGKGFGKPSRHVTNHLGQLSLPSLQGR